MQLEAFLQVCDQFRLGELVTEQPHPATVGLAEQAQRDLVTAIEAFHTVDLAMMERLRPSLERLPELTDDIRRTCEAGGRIFVAGCGATGRLALSLETFARESWAADREPCPVIAFMAGGDAALIRSIESFEDFPEYGARQLMELGYGKNDLLIAITEGGETPFVIGACQKAAALAERAPWFLFCNPPALLSRLAERSREVLASPHIQPFFIDTGPMALAGSTRLQATTAQMLVTGAALSEAFGGGKAEAIIAAFHDALRKHDPLALAPFIEAEATVYAQGDHVLYQTDHYGMTVLTDTTERSPTFSLAPFENRFREEDAGSWCYLSLPEAKDAARAWKTMLHREPRTLEWPDLDGKASREHLLGHDISREAAHWRAAQSPDKKQFPYLIHGPGPLLEFAGHSRDLLLSEAPLLVRHLLLKCSLNLQSTLVMGRLGLYESNLMTRVKPSNYKLIDRAARHAQHHHRQQTGLELPYEAAVRQVFASLGK